MYCKECNKKRLEIPLQKGIQYDPKLIVFCLDLYFNGMSFRKVARSINDHFKLSMDHATVYYWVKKYIPQIKEAMNDLIMSNNEFTKLHVDEVYVRLRGQQNVNKMGYLWNIIDSKTRFLLASEVTKYRTTVNAKRIIQDVMYQLKKKPDLVITDKYPGYYPAIKKLGLQHSSNKRENNMVERLNGEMRARIKTQRGWKSDRTMTPDGFYLNYNFVTPHGALDGKTPAQMMNLVDDKMSWYQLFEYSKVLPSIIK